LHYLCYTRYIFVGARSFRSITITHYLLPHSTELQLTCFCVIISFHMNDPLKEALVVATQKLNEFVAARGEIDKQRGAIDAQIIHWKQLVDSLRTVCADEDEDPSDVEVSAFVEGKPGKQTVKFTDGVRMVFKQNQNTILTAPEIRNGLLNLGFDFSKYSQPMTPIHNCLKRLEEQGEVKPEKTKDGQIIGYKWISSIERALAEEPPSFAEALGLAGHYPDMKRAAERAAEMHQAVLQADIKAGQRAAKLAAMMQYPKKPKKD
jgi:hypothetical protein